MQQAVTIHQYSNERHGLSLPNAWKIGREIPRSFKSTWGIPVYQPTGLPAFSFCSHSINGWK
jgi:DNA polymerase III alpha subunit